MLKTFIFEDESYPIDQINTHLYQKLTSELQSLVERDIFPMKEARKLVKRVENLVKKYNNILINRSGLFNKEIIRLVKQLIIFYYDLLFTYEEHKVHSSKTIIIDNDVISIDNHYFS